MKIRMLCCLMALLMLFSTSALAGETVTVQGEGLVYLDADRASFYVGVRENGEDVMFVQNAVNERIANVINVFTQMGIDKKDMATNAISIYPVYDYSDGGEKITGYTAYNSICVQTGEIDRVGEYIDAAFEAGANTLDSVDFSAVDTSEASKQALQLAVKAARDKADVLAEAAGMKVVSVESIVEQSGYSYGNGLFRYAESASTNDAAGTQVITSQLQVCANVSVTYEMEPVA